MIVAFCIALYCISGRNNPFRLSQIATWLTASQVKSKKRQVKSLEISQVEPSMECNLAYLAHAEPCRCLGAQQRPVSQAGTEAMPRVSFSLGGLADMGRHAPTLTPPPPSLWRQTGLWA